LAGAAAFIGASPFGTALAGLGAGWLFAAGVALLVTGGTFTGLLVAALAAPVAGVLGAAFFAAALFTPLGADVALVVAGDALGSSPLADAEVRVRRGIGLLLSGEGATD
jgi:hypothetical protein